VSEVVRGRGRGEGVKREEGMEVEGEV